MELKNSKLTYLGKATNGERLYSLKAFISAIQMSADGKAWQNIKPQLVRDADGWHVEGAPYYAEIKDDGTRLFCPDRTERSKYLRLPTIPLFNGLTKKVVSIPSQLDGELLPNQIVMPTAWGEIRVIFRNQGAHFQILCNTAPPLDRLTLDIDPAGFDIPQMLKATSGLRIPRPKLIDAEETEREVEWSYKNGQLELGLDFTGLKFPVLFKNATFVVGASEDDIAVWWNGSTWVRSLTLTSQEVGYSSATLYKEGGGMRFQSVNIPAGANITAATLTFKSAVARSNTTVNSVILGELNANAAVFSDITDYKARRGTIVGGANNNNITSASVAWNNMEAWAYNATKTSPDFSSVIQEMVDTLGALTNIVIFWDDHAGTSTAVNSTNRLAASYDHASLNPPALDVTYSVGGEDFYWKSGIQYSNPSVWVSEIDLKNCSPDRINKANQLIALLGE